MHNAPEKTPPVFAQNTALLAGDHVQANLVAAQVSLDTACAAELANLNDRVPEGKSAELKAAFSELQAKHLQLVQSAKMASLAQLVAGIAHEINNPLAFVLGHLNTALRCMSHVAEHLPEDLPDGATHSFRRASERLNELSPGLERIRELVVKLHTFSRLGEGEQKQVNVQESVESVLTILGHRLGDGIRVETRFSPPYEIECYAGLLNQAVMSLVCNALDAMAGAGVLGISAGATGASYTITISDTGAGIPIELRERVFEPFFSTKPIGDGTGLGLSIAYSIARKHGGVLELLDSEAGGTSAVIRIPLTPCHPR